MGTPRQIDAILLNIKANRPKLVGMCRYKLATYWQNFMKIYLTRVKILQKVLGGGLLYDSQCIRQVLIFKYMLQNKIKYVDIHVFGVSMCIRLITVDHKYLPFYSANNQFAYFLTKTVIS